MPRLLSALLFGSLPLLLLSSCGGDEYAVGLPDEDYDLGAMALQEEDTSGYIRDSDRPSDNEEFALLFDTDDTDAKKRQLDATGRIRGHMAFFYQDPVDDYGQPLVFYSSSTLYVDDVAARESIRTTCGLPIEITTDVHEFRVPRIGDEAAGFTTVEEDPFSHVNICFRTGRVVHAIVLRGLRGVEDLSLSVRLAQRMLKHVDAAFAGDTPPSGSEGG